MSATTPTPYETVYGPTRAFVYSCEFHQRAGMGDTRLGDNSSKNSRVLSAQKGYEAFLPERVKAHRQAGMARAS